jgi:acyl transferase domain-containing protein
VRRAGVSSFGISGTNAHVVIEEATLEPAGQTGPAPVGGPVAWVLSAKSTEALRGQAARLGSFADALETSVDPYDIGYSLALTRTAFDERAVAVGSDIVSLRAKIHAIAQGTAGSLPGVARGRRTKGRLAVLFPGQGPQRPGMGRELYDTYPVFAEAFDMVVAEFDRHLLRPLKEIVLDDAAALDRTEFTQPALFAVEVAIYRLYESWGVRPDALAGHSMGELTAAHMAGLWDLADAARLVAARGRLMQAVPADGAMIAVQATEDEVLPLLTDGVGLAAINGPRAVVVSGAAAEAEAVGAHFAALGRKTRRLAISLAGHSPLMEPILEEFRQIAAELTYQEPRIPVISTVTGAPATREELASPDYWVRNVRDTVRFADSVRVLRAQGVVTFLELSPTAVLSLLGPDCLDASDDGVAFLPALRADAPDAQTALTAAGGLFARGVPIDWTALFPAARGVDLPTYAFQRRNYWLEAGTVSTETIGTSGAETDPDPETEAATRRALLAQLAGLTADEQLARLVGLIVAEANAARTEQNPDESFDSELDGDSAFFEVGFNSLSAVELRNRLVEATDLTLSPMLLFDYPTPAHVAEFLLPQLAVSSTAARPGLDRPVTAGGDPSDRWCYRVVWRPVDPEGAPSAPTALPVPAASPSVDLGGSWLLVVPAALAHGPHARFVAAALAAHGGDPVRALPVDLAGGGIDAAWFADQLDAADPRRVVSLLGLAPNGHPAHPTVPAGVAATLELVRALAGREVAVPVWTVTSGAVRTGQPDDPAPVPEQAQLWGIGRTVALEHPKLWGGLVDLPDLAPTSDLAPTAAAGPTGLAAPELGQRFARLLAGADGQHHAGGPTASTGYAEDQVALRSAGTFARRVTRAGLRSNADGWHPHGTVLVTGGTGGIGAHLARWLAEHGAENLILTSRRGGDAPGAADLVAELTADQGTDTAERHPVTVTVLAADTADPASVDVLRAALDAAGPPLTAVFHVAGLAQESAPVSTMTPAEYAEVVAAKTTGARLLAAAVADHPVETFVLFSSSAGVWGAGGQGAYAAGNAHLDALAHRLRGEGRPALSVAWGAWAGGGMLADPRAAASLERLGLRQMAPALALRALAAAIAADEMTLSVTDIDWSRFAPTFSARRPSPLLSEIDDVRTALGLDAPGSSAAAADTPGGDGTGGEDARARLQARLAAAPTP